MIFLTLRNKFIIFMSFWNKRVLIISCILWAVWCSYWSPIQIITLLTISVKCISHFFNIGSFKALHGKIRSSFRLRRVDDMSNSLSHISSCNIKFYIEHIIYFLFVLLLDFIYLIIFLVVNWRTLRPLFLNYFFYFLKDLLSFFRFFNIFW